MELALYAPCPTLKRHDITLFKKLYFSSRRAAYSKLRLEKKLRLTFSFIIMPWAEYLSAIKT